MKLIYLISRVFFGLDFFKFSGPGALCVFIITIFRAQYSLPPDVISYLDRSFTKKGLKNLQEKSGISGKRKVNYPKRSEIIKFELVKIQNSPPSPKGLEKVHKNQELKKVPGYSGYRLPGYGTQEPILDETLINVDSYSSEWEGRNFVMVEKNSENNSSSYADQIQFHVKNEIKIEENVTQISNGQDTDPLKMENDFDGQFNWEFNPLIKIEEI